MKGKGRGLQNLEAETGRTQVWMWFSVLLGGSKPERPADLGRLSFEKRLLGGQKMVELGGD